ncbi:MAG: DUF1360 domain-containing protein [Firmicutes bacterium]|nr:DUF1360 domain-containing protein [Bacillota bacterium]
MIDMGNISWVTLVVLGLASFRLTHLLVFDEVMQPLRGFFLDYREQDLAPSGLTFTAPTPRGRGIRNLLGRILRCHWCAGFWVSLLLLVLYTVWAGPFVHGIIALLAISAIQSLVEHWVQTRI